MKSGEIEEKYLEWNGNGVATFGNYQFTGHVPAAADGEEYEVVICDSNGKTIASAKVYTVLAAQAWVEGFAKALDILKDQ